MLLSSICWGIVGFTVMYGGAIQQTLKGSLQEDGGQLPGPKNEGI